MTGDSWYSPSGTEGKMRVGVEEEVEVAISSLRGNDLLSEEDEIPFEEDCSSAASPYSSGARRRMVAIEEPMKKQWGMHLKQILRKWVRYADTRNCEGKGHALLRESCAW